MRRSKRRKRLKEKRKEKRKASTVDVRIGDSTFTVRLLTVAQVSAILEQYKRDMTLRNAGTDGTIN